MPFLPTMFMSVFWIRILFEMILSSVDAAPIQILSP